MELLGLKWTDLDWSRQTLKIARQLLRPEEDGAQFAPPKTRFGKRSILLGKKTIEIFRKHYERHQQQRKMSGDTWWENGLIFTTRIGTPIHPHNLWRDY